MSSPWDPEPSELQRRTLPQLYGDQPPDSPLPPLRLHHLMLWTAVASVIYAGVFALVRGSSELGAQGSGLYVAWLLPVTAKIAALLVVLRARLRERFAWQPGQGLLVLTGLLLPLHLLQLAMVNWLVSAGSSGYLAYQALGFAAGLVAFIAGIVLARVFWSQPWWGWAFLAAACQPIAAFVLRALLTAFVYSYSYHQSLAVSYTAQLLPQACVALFVLLSVRSDRRAGRARHWTHWVGVGALLLQLPIAAATYAYNLSRPEPVQAGTSSGGTGSGPNMPVGAVLPAVSDGPGLARSERKCYPQSNWPCLVRSGHLATPYCS